MKRETFEKLSERWLNEQLISEVSKKGPRFAIKAFLEFCEGKQPGRELLVKWIIGWEGADSTMQNYASAVKRFFGWMGNEGLYKNIGFGLKSYLRKNWEHTHLPLKEEEVERLLIHLAEYEQTGNRDLVIILLMLNCGLRVCEVQRARIVDLQDEPAPCLKVYGKGHIYPDARVMLAGYLADKLRWYLRIRPGPKDSGSNLFLTMMRPYGPLSGKQIANVCGFHLREIGLLSPLYSAYSFRHTAATIALQRGATEEQVSRMLRHVDPRTTRLYTRFIDRLKNPAEKFLDFKLPEEEAENILPFKIGG